MSNAQSGHGTSDLAWFKSSYSSSEGGACVEVATAADGIRVRDSKNTDGAQLAVTPASWTAFVGQLHT